tara:strand:- start:340 stop:1029 length:690 start_codon:yes stop_codon:yes gene_type:complete
MNRTNSKLNNTIKGIGSVLVVGLICLLLFIQQKTNIIFQSIVIWLIVFIISYWCTKCILSSLISSIILVVALSFVCYRKQHVYTENFETINETKNNDLEITNPVSEKDDNDKEETKDQIKQDISDTKNLMDSLDKMIVNKNMNLKNMDFNTLKMGEIDNMLKYSPSDEKEDKQGNTISDSKKIRTPAEAQRETYRLIDTVKQLDSTLKALGPTLTQGKEIINMFDKIKM